MTTTESKPNKSTQEQWVDDGKGVGAHLDLTKDFPVPSLDEWRAVVEKDLKGQDFERRLIWKTLEGIDVKPLYTRHDLEGLSHLGTIPGQAPFVRGTNALSGISPTWQIRQDCLSAAPEDVNAAVRDGLARGQTAVAIRLDDAARRGFDGDSPEARDLAGRFGCTLSSINGLRIALADIDLEKFPVTIRTGTSALPVLAMLVALADEREVPREKLSGSVECDPMRDLVKSGSLRGSFDLVYREMADMVKFCRANCPGLRPVTVNSHPYHNAGGTLVQELAYTLSTGIEYLRAMTAQGITPDDAAISMIFSFSVSTNLFMEIAKLRAARLLWAKIVKSFGATNPDSMKMFLHARTSSWTKTVHDPYNNMIRTTIEGFAAAVGGCDSMYIAPFDECVGRADVFSSRIARNQQLLLQEEAHLAKIVDAGGGSYYIESLTDSLARAAWSTIQGVEAEGGMAKALAEGLPQGDVLEAAAKKEQLIAQRRLPVVGVSNYPNVKEKLLERQRLDREDFLARRARRVSRLRSVRNNAEVRQSLSMLTACVYDGGNMMELAVKAASKGATIGEILRAACKGDEGVAPSVKRLGVQRISMPYEQLRIRAKAYEAEVGHLPRVALVTTGPLGMRRARADFSQGFFGAAGFESVEVGPFDDMEKAVAAAREHDPLLLVICSDDETYATAAPALVEKAKAVDANLAVVVAGYPADSVEALKAAGVDEFIHVKANVVTTLKGLMDRLNIGV